MSVRREWTSRWGKLRREFLEGRLPMPEVLPVPGTENRWWWSCTECEEVGSEVTSEAMATTTAANHAQQHPSAADVEALEALKVTLMPEALLSPYQRSFRDALDPPGPQSVEEARNRADGISN